MRIIPTFDFTTLEPTQGSLKIFVQMLRKLYMNLATAFNGQVGFGRDGVNRDNIDGNWGAVTTPATPNTDFTVSHNLGRIPIGYLVMAKTGPVDVYSGSGTPTTTQINLRATTGGVFIRLFIFCLLFAIGARAQTTVNLSVTDAPDGQTWNNGTWSATLKQAAGTVGGPPFNIISGGGSVNPQAGLLSTTGTASMALPANANIAPAQSVWLFNICPDASSQCFTQEVTVVVSSPQTLALVPPSIRINILITPPPIKAYTDVEIQGAVKGSLYFNVSTLLYRQCNAASNNNCTAWANIGSAALHGSGPPVGSCFAGFFYTDDTTGNVYSCQGGTWLFVGPTTSTASPACSTDLFTATPTYTFIGSNDQCHIMTLTGNVSTITINGTFANHSQIFLKYPQDGTGGRTVGFPGNFVFPTGFTLKTSANAQNNMGWTYDGSVWRPILDFGGGSGGGGGTPAGANGAVQINLGGTFSASGNVFDLNSILLVNEDAEFHGPNPVGVDVRLNGAVSYNPNAPPASGGFTASCNGTVNITLSNAEGLANGNGISIKGCGATNTMTTPGAPTVTTNFVQAGMNTGNVVAGLTGSTTYNYKIAAQDLGSGITASSATASVTTGPASLGAQSTGLTSCTRSNATVTCTTSSAHTMGVGAEIKIRGMADTTFNINSNAATVPDNTHFTYTSPLDTRNGANQSSTGGTVVYWPENHITWSAVPGAYRYLICSDRGSPGTFNVIGISKPSYPGTIPGSGIGTDGSLYFDDYGTVTTYPNPPWPIPSTCPATATNDTLTTTIASGGGTTSITVANTASQTLAGTPARADNAANIKNAASNGVGTVLIPAGGNYVTNSILDLSQIQGVMLNVLNVQQNWGDTVIFGYKSGIHGSRPVVSAGGAESFCGGSYSDQIVTGMPGFHFAGNPFSSASYLQIDGQSNGETTVVIDGSGGETQGFEINNACVFNGVSGGTVDDMSMAIMVRPTPGQSGQFTSSGRLAVGAVQGETNAETPTIYNSNTGQNKISELFVSGRGPMFQASSTGSHAHIEWYYCQGCQTPLISVAGNKTGGGNAQFDLSGTQLENDTSVSPIITAFPASGPVSLSVTGFQDALTFGSPGYSGTPAQYMSANIGGQNVSSETIGAFAGTGAGAIDGIFNTSGVVGAGAYANKNFNAALSSGTAYPIFVTGPVMAAPVLSGGAPGSGSVPAIPIIYQVIPIWPNGGSGPSSLGATITPSGSQAVNLTWTPTTGCTGYWIARIAGGGNNLTATNSGIASGCNTSSFSDTSGLSGGQTPNLNSGGPSMLMPGVQGMASPSIDLNADVTLSAPGGGTAYTLNFPTNQPAPGNTSLSCTATNPSNCSWVGAGTGVPWNNIGNPTGALNLSMAGFNSTFSYTSGLNNAFEWVNGTPATLSLSAPSPILSDCGQAWVGASNLDCWTFQHIPGNGVNAPITDSYGHSGSSTGTVTSTFPGPLSAGPGTGAAGALILPQGTSNGTTGAALTVQGATSITPYSIALPGTAPTAGNTTLSCSAATSSVCSWTNSIGTTASTYDIRINGSTITATSGVGLAQVTGTDFAVVMNSAISNAASICGTFTIGPGVYPVNSMTLETTGGYSNVYYGVAVPANQNSANQYCQWNFVGQSASTTGTSFGIPLNGVTVQVTSAARTSCGATHNCYAWWSRPDTTNHIGNDVTFKNITTTFPDNQRGNEGAYVFWEAASFDAYAVIASLNTTLGPGTSPSISPAVAGANHSFGFASPMSSHNNWIRYANTFVGGYDICYDIEGEHSITSSMSAEFCNTFVSYGRTATYGSYTSTAIYHPGIWDHPIDQESINGIVIGSNMAQGSRLDIISDDIETTTSGSFARVSNMSEANNGYTTGFIYYTVVNAGTGIIAETPGPGLFSSGGSNFQVFEGTTSPSIAKVASVDGFTRPNLSPSTTPNNLGPAWLNNVSNSSCGISSNTAIASATSGISCETSYTAQSFNNDQFGKLTVGSVNANSNLGVMVRASTTVNTRTYYVYYCKTSIGTNQRAIWKSVAGVFTQLGGLASAACSAGDTLELWAVGNTLLGYYTPSGGTRVLDLITTDSSITSGEPGLFMNTNANSSSPSVSNWVGGSLTANNTGASIYGQNIIAPTYNTLSNCSVNSVSPAACGSAAAGAFVVPTSTASYTVNTTAVTSHSRIFLEPLYNFASDLPGSPTCVVPSLTSTMPILSGMSAGTSFTITLTSTTGQTCFQYWIVN